MKQQNRKMRARRAQTSTSATSFSGKFPTSALSTDVVEVILVENDTISVSAGGAISAAFNNNPSSANNFTEYSTIFDEYRVLAVKHAYDPNNVVNTATLNGFNGYNAIVHGIATAPTSLNEAASTGVAKRWNAFKPFSRIWKMSGSTENNWVSTSGPAANSSTLLLYAVNGTASQYYGNVLTEYLVQFRSKRK